MTKIISNAMMLALLTTGAFGCGDDTMSGNMNTDMSASQFSTAPTLKSQIDRMGRAAINTALTDPFYTDMTAHNVKLDAYNKAPRSMWPTFTAQFAASLAVFDGIDGVCDNQPLATVDGGANEYTSLAGILADDELLLDTTVASCASASNYLAVEASVITKTTAASCGGRTPLDNSIDVSYAVLTGGIFSGVAVSNGVTADGDGASAMANITTFPYLAAPL